jgi:prepilin-type N-terminal cleavage/methylation domain-containing protein
MISRAPSSIDRMRRRQRASREAMTLIEVVVVIVIIGLAGAGLSFSLGALTRTNLKSGAVKLASASRFAYYRAVIQGRTVRLVFDIPGNTFSLEEAAGQVTLARADDERRAESVDGEGQTLVAADPWAAAKSRIDQALKPNLGASPFKPLSSEAGVTLSKYQKVELGRRVQIVKLIVAHEPTPLEQGQGSVYFFPGGMTEHAVVQLSDGSDTVFSVELHPLTGRAQVHAEAYEPDDLLDDPDDPEASEVRL